MGSFLGSVSSQQKFEAMDIKALGQTVSQLSDRSMSQLRVTAQFYLENKGKYILEAWKGSPFLHQGYADSKDAKRRERRESTQESEPWPFGSSFYVFLSLGLPYGNWASQECCLFLLRSPLRCSDLPLFYFHGLFPSLSFSHRHSGFLFPVLTT